MTHAHSNDQFLKKFSRHVTDGVVFQQTLKLFMPPRNSLQIISYAFSIDESQAGRPAPVRIITTLTAIASTSPIKGNSGLMVAKIFLRQANPQKGLTVPMVRRHAMHIDLAFYVVYAKQKQLLRKSAISGAP